MKFGKSIHRLFVALSAFAVVLTMVGCAPDPEDREWEWLPDMYRNPALKPQEAYPFLKNRMASLVPPDGALPEGYVPYPYAIAEGVKAGEELENPLPLTMEVLEMGRKYYNINCIVCHGATGAGDGLATLAHRENGMPIPPQLYTDKIREWGDGQIYHTIMVGQGNMPPYGQRIDEDHRWAIVHYVRALAIAANPSEEDLQEVEKRKWEAKEMDNPFSDRNPLDADKFMSVYPRNNIVPMAQEQD